MNQTRHHHEGNDFHRRAGDTVVLDKTGTLTLGLPRVTAIQPLNGATEDEVLQTAAIAEQHSEHPLGEAIVRQARKRNVALREYSDFHYYPGKGLSCVDGGSEILVGTRALFEERGISFPGKEQNGPFVGQAGTTVVLVGRNRRILGTVTLADQLRVEAKDTVARLNRRGYDTILLTGDAHETAKAVGTVSPFTMNLLATKA